jgi:hypothetical protein
VFYESQCAFCAYSRDPAAYNRFVWANLSTRRLGVPGGQSSEIEWRLFAFSKMVI